MKKNKRKTGRTSQIWARSAQRRRRAARIRVEAELGQLIQGEAARAENGQRTESDSNPTVDRKNNGDGVVFLAAPARARRR